MTALLEYLDLFTTETKQEFWDALHLRYGWTLLNTPSHCVCGSPFTADHAMICRHGGLTFVRHNDLRDTTAELLSNVCTNVIIIIIIWGKRADSKAD